MTLDRAVDETKQFNAQVREWLRHEVEAAVNPLIEKVRTLTRVIDTMSKREDKTATAVANMAADFSRFAGWATNRGLREDMIERKLDALLAIVSPELIKELTTRPTPP